METETGVLTAQADTVPLPGVSPTVGSKALESR